MSSGTSSTPTRARVRRSSPCRRAACAPADLHHRESGINGDLPLLGHEAPRVVEAVGEAVTDVAPGDLVILNWRPVCGSRRACAKGKSWYCFDPATATQKMTLPDGTELSPAVGIGAIVEKTLVASGQCTTETRQPESTTGRGPRAGRRRARRRCVPSACP